jgi:hypothetical protein
VLLKRWYNSTRLHGAVSQKAIFTLAVVRIRNLTNVHIFYRSLISSCCLDLYLSNLYRINILIWIIIIFIFVLEYY